MTRISIRFASIFAVLLAFGTVPSVSADETGMGKPGSNQTSSTSATMTTDCGTLSSWLGLCGSTTLSGDE